MTTFVRVVSLVAPHWRWLAAAILLGILAVGSNIALVAMSAYLISKAAIASGVAEVALVITAVRVLAISRSGFLYMERYATHRTAFRILSQLRVWFFRSIEPLAPAGLGEKRSGDLLTRAVADVDSLEDLYVRVLTPPIVAAVTVALASLAFGLVDVQLGLLLLAFLVVTGLVLPLISRWISRQSTQALAALRGELGALVVDEVQGIADLVALDQAASHRTRLLDVAGGLDAARQRIARVEAVSTATAILMASLASLLILVLAIPLVSSGRIEGVFLAALPLAAIATFETVQPLSRSVQLLDTSRASAERLFSLIDEPLPIVDPATPDPLPGSFDLDVSGISFRHADQDPLALTEVSLSIAAGETVALVGPSGSGKSTLVDLLLRFWEYDEGAILIGGRELRKMAASEVRTMLGVVPQDIHLFNTTIRENLALADPDLEDGRLAEVCRIAQLQDWIETLPLGYETVVGEGGVLLSGGERRRLAIARVLVKAAPIVIFDEATADLDTVTEARLWESLAPFLDERTVLLISHRPFTGPHVDRTVSLAVRPDVEGASTFPPAS